MMKEVFEIELGPLGRLAGAARNHLGRHWSKALVVSVKEKHPAWVKVCVVETNVNEPLMKRRKCQQMTSKRGLDISSPMSTAGTCLLAVRCPAFRWREHYAGVYGKQEKQPCNAKGKGAIPEREAVSTNVHGCGGPHRSNVEALETWWSEGYSLFGLQALTTAKAGGSGWK